jgi:transglutaminase-like putative cysteine protease
VKPRFTAWSDDETNSLFVMKEQGFEWPVIAESLDRSIPSCKERWRWARRSEADKQARREKMQGMRRRGKEDREYAFHYVSRERVPDEVLIERNKRMMAPRSLTAWFCGDPAPGHSALDRREK